MALREVLSATGECCRRHRFLVPNWFFIPINHASEHARELPKVTTQCICNKLAAATEHTAVTLDSDFVFVLNPGLLSLFQNLHILQLNDFS